jgi:hypothetical protein
MAAVYSGDEHYLYQSSSGLLFNEILLFYNSRLPISVGGLAIMPILALNLRRGCAPTGVVTW